MGAEMDDHKNIHYKEYYKETKEQSNIARSLQLLVSSVNSENKILHAQVSSLKKENRSFNQIFSSNKEQLELKDKVIADLKARLRDTLPVRYVEQHKIKPNVNNE